MHETVVDILILLAAALALGMLAERLRLSAILGYLVAGTLVGPNVLGWVNPSDRVDYLAELGASLLLFTIGTDFSVRRLKQLGRRAFAAGVLQVVVTVAAGYAIAAATGLGHGASFALGAVLALSSTAVVARLLIDTRTIDTAHGRNAIGVLLVQDISVVPIVLALSFAGTEGGGGALVDAAVRAALYAGLLVASFVLLVRFVIPRVLGAQAMVRNRDLAIVFALVCAIGSAIGAESAQLPPALGAFVAGVLLGGSPFAAQIRADVAPLHIILLTLFFAAIGLAGDPAWAARNAPLVLATLAIVIVGKALLAAGAMRIVGISGATALAAGAALAQIGEFSFIVAESARDDGFLNEETFRLVVTVTVASLALAPLMVSVAARIAGPFDRRRAAPARAGKAGEGAGHGGGDDRNAVPAIILVGFGPAGQTMLDRMHESMRRRTVVIDSNPAMRERAIARGAMAEIGDAGRREVLEHAGAAEASAIVLSMSDAGAVAHVTALARSIAPNATVVARARYHLVHPELERAGAHMVVDEETLVGARLADEAERAVRLREATGRLGPGLA
jgi:CPA2 family monovalent cation:H+ antiporter-2